MTIYTTSHGTATPNPYADRIEELEAKLVKAAKALSDLADCVDLGCFCSEMEQATVMDKARTTLAELTGAKDE